MYAEGTIPLIFILYPFAGPWRCRAASCSLLCSSLCRSEAEFFFLANLHKWDSLYMKSSFNVISLIKALCWVSHQEETSALCSVVFVGYGLRMVLFTILAKLIASDICLRLARAIRMKFWFRCSIYFSPPFSLNVEILIASNLVSVIGDSRADPSCVLALKLFSLFALSGMAAIPADHAPIVTSKLLLIQT